MTCVEKYVVEFCILNRPRTTERAYCEECMNAKHLKSVKFETYFVCIQVAGDRAADPTD